MNNDQKQEKSFLEVTADTAFNGFVGGFQASAGIAAAVVTLGQETKTLEESYEKLKKSVKGGHEMGKRIGKAIGEALIE